MSLAACGTTEKKISLQGKAMITPSTPRELFELLRRYDVSADMSSFARSIDWSELRPHHIYWLVLQRLPESAKVAVPGPDYSAREHATAALLGPEFQRSIIKLVADAYPEKRRLIHVHIQKTAGLDLKENLSARLPALPISLSQDEITSKRLLISAVRSVINNLHQADSLYIGGHKELSWYLKHSLYRFGDRLFAVVRHPHDIILSYINFIIGRFIDDPQLKRYDTRDWAGVIGLEKLPELRDPKSITEIASRLLLTRKSIIRPNFLCTYLGYGTAESAFEMMARTNIEITDITRYKRWLVEAWGINSGTRINRSTQHISFESFSASQKEYIQELCEQDMLLYPSIIRALDRSSAPYVLGSEIPE
jgi:hypothetical protein